MSGAIPTSPITASGARKGSAPGLIRTSHATSATASPLASHATPITRKTQPALFPGCLVRIRIPVTIQTIMRTAAATLPTLGAVVTPIGSFAASRSISLNTVGPSAIVGSPITLTTCGGALALVLIEIRRVADTAATAATITATESPRFTRDVMTRGSLLLRSGPCRRSWCRRRGRS